MAEHRYPVTRTMDQTDDYHGRLVPDPYRWLEDVDSPETAAWIEAQNRLTFEFLSQIPARDRIKQRLTELWDFLKKTAPIRRGERYFQFRNSGLQNQDVLFVMEDLAREGRMLLDPNSLSEDGTVALNNWSVSRDGEYLAYGTSASGSDWVTYRVRQVASGKDLEDEILWSKFSDASWLPDGSGFFYNRYAEPVPGQVYEETNYDQKLYLHRLGRSQAQDELIYERPDHKTWGFSAEVTDDGRFLVLHVNEGTDHRNRLFYQDLQARGVMVELIDQLEASFEYLGSDGPLFYLLTDLDAPLSRVIAVDINHPARSSWQTLIPESEDRLELVKIIHNEFIALYLHNAYHLIKRFDLAGNPLADIKLPGLGALQEYAYVKSLHGRREDNELFYAYNSFTIPPSIYQYDFTSDKNTLIYQPELQFDFDNTVTEQVFVESKDGTSLPLFLTYRRDLVKDGKNPTLLYGYGGFNIPILPAFAIPRLVWIEMGGVYAQAVLRGGGEFGESWHAAGSGSQKQNVFDDFIASAEYLVASGVTNPSKLAIEGRSNGGLLVGACLSQRPDLFAAALPAVGVMDMLRFHKFTIGWAWVSDYGSPDDPDDFEVLFSYSPLHNIKPGTNYPATLITTADHDDRVVPGHSFKFAAALQAAQAGDKPVLIRVQTKAGHGFGKPTAVLIQEQADILAFLVKTLNFSSALPY
jgi:prolyl oligopeptidase